MATIVVPASKVLFAAAETIKNIKAYRKDKDKTTLAEAMMPTKLFGFTIKGRSRDRAIAYLRENAWGWYPSCYRYDDLQHATKLYLLAQHGDPVTLNEEDCRVLFS